MATFVEMQHSDPDIRAEYDLWRGLREERGENPVDWDAFRAHLIAIGHNDPGDVPPDDWVGEDYKAANPEWWANYTSRVRNIGRSNSMGRSV